METAMTKPRNTNKPKPIQVLRAVEMVQVFCEQQGISPELLMFDIVQAFNDTVDAHAKEQGLEGVPLGHVNSFSPRGPLNADDKGLTLARIGKRSDGIVYLDLGKVCVNWLALTPSQCRTVAKQLVEAADEPTPKPTLAGLPGSNG
jgi:hypothetical protein